MAASGKSTANDLLQICLLTFYLMAIFFGCWGVFYGGFRGPRERAERDKQFSRYKNLTDLLQKQESKETLREYRRKAESAKVSTSIQNDVNEVLEASGKALKIGSLSAQGSKVLPGTNISEQEASLSFKETSLRSGLLHFVFNLLSMKSHISIKSMQFNRKGSGDKDEWSSDIKLVTYSGTSTNP
ncbi:MAG: hypothetical protein ACKVX7_11550 [Planctomycetota bacterium]